MPIDTDLLSSYGATVDTFDPNDIIFEEGETPKYYYQIISGNVKLNYTDEDGKELILSILKTGQSACEFLLFLDEKYPVTAVAISQSTIMKVPKHNFLEMLDNHPKSCAEVRRFVSERLYHKFIVMQNNSSHHAEVRIKGILTYFKNESDSNNDIPYSYEVPLTRQQLASITGLRVETVIRCIKKMESEKTVEIIKGKIFF